MKQKFAKNLSLALGFILTLIILAFVLRKAFLHDELFLPPESSNSQAIEKLITDDTAEMAFMNFGDSIVTFGHINNKTVFTLDVKMDLLKILAADKRDLFQCQEDYCYYCFGDCIGSREAYKQYLKESNSVESTKQQETWFDPNYHLARPLKLPTSTSISSISETELVDILKNRKVIFYTGAGLSISVVPSMAKLISVLAQGGFKDKRPFSEWGRTVMANPQQLATAMDFFYRQLFYAQPTAGHYAIKQIANYLRVKIFTENLDYLHERSGIKPIHIEGDFDRFKRLYNFSRVDYIVCLGLSHDDRGLLSHFKQVNPAGKIISIDIGRPDYLTADDYLINVDLQIILPKLKEII